LAPRTYIPRIPPTREPTIRVNAKNTTPSDGLDAEAAAVLLD
jgi:hypothetical protein